MYNAWRVFLGADKDPLNGLLLVKPLVFWRTAGVARQALIALPDMPLYCFDTVLEMST